MCRGTGADIEDVEDFCARVRPQLVRSLVASCRDVGAAEDLAQETLARAWQRWDHVGRLDSPEAWRHRVAMNLSHSRWRRVHAEARALARTGPGDAVIDAGVSVVDDRDHLAEAARHLSTREREILALRHVADLSVEEVADQLGCPPGTVRSTSSRATAKARAAVAAAALLGAAAVVRLLPAADPTPPTIVDVIGDGHAPTHLPDGYASCDATTRGARAWCDGDARVELRSGPHDALEEVGAPVPVGPRTGYVVTLPDGRRQLTVSDRTSSADVHYRVVAHPDVGVGELVRMVESIPAFAGVTAPTG